MTDHRPSRRDLPWSKHHPDQPAVWDTVVIGSGIGGMTAAAMLAKLGEKVLVLEQHYTPGGFTHTFRRKHWQWDVGVHAVGEVTEHSLPGRLLAHLTDGRLRWASLGPVYDEFWWPDGVRVDFPDNPQAFRDALVAAFPDESRAIDAYLHEVKRVAAAMRGYYLARVVPRRLSRAADRLLARDAEAAFSRTAAEVLAELTDNPKLRAVLASQWGYYGAPPSRASFAMQALVTKHFLWGGYYPVGGSGEIAKQLLTTVADAGGWTRVMADVEEILIERDRAVGVCLVGGETIRAKRVISAAGARATATRLLPPSHRAADWAEDVGALPPGPAHVCLYLGFEGDIRAAGASGANKWFYGTWDLEWDAWRPTSATDVPPCHILYTSFPSLKDPEHDAGDGPWHTGEIVTFVPWETFGPWQGSRWKRRPDDYDAFKKAMTDALLEGLLAHMPALRPMIRHAELSTPLTTDHFVRPVHGSIYGLAPTPARFANRWLRPKSPVNGLFLAGSEVATVGVVGAMMGGALAAVAARPIAGAGLVRKVW